MERISIGLILLFPVAAMAESKSFDVDHLQLASSGGDFLATEHAGQVRAWDWQVRAAFRYDDLPLVLERGGVRQPLVAARSLIEVAASVELWRWVGLGVSLPVLLDEHGQAVTSGAALGDLRLVPRVELLRDGRFGLAVLLGLRVPTGDTGRFIGEGGAVFEPRLAGELYLGMVRLGLNVGVRVRPARQYLDLRVGNEVFGSLAVAVVPRPWLDVFAEIHGDTAMSSAFGSAQSTPVEALAGIAAGWRGLRASLAGGFGLVGGFGSPRARALVTLEYRRPQPPARPRAAAVVVEAAPLHQPPAPAPLPELEASLPIVLDDAPAVSIEAGRIELADPIFFETDRKRIRHRYYDELEQLARVLRRLDAIETIWIEGHADATGPERWNLELSRARAAQVAAYLSAHGVDPARLRPTGFGEARPLMPTPPGEPNERNRRVHFFIDGAPQPRPIVERSLVENRSVR